MPVSAMVSGAKRGPRQKAASMAVEESGRTARNDCEDPRARNDEDEPEPNPEEPNPKEERRGSMRKPLEESGRAAAEPEECRGLRAMSLRRELVLRDESEPEELVVRETELEVCRGPRIESCEGFEGWSTFSSSRADRTGRFGPAGLFMKRSHGPSTRTRAA